ncbi:peptidase C15, pyroglutamyl peptidase I-like protein [Lentithecium fluviatile CBS 122367]|uniref:Peptidase C15, pyroglutamyl peptidase I-like protein n=1 Tax=Lentithecium fluviatile CBS 122367 TaxID=1168545 RepID=A0A6G1IKX6_9PLEO|nr:peptidase C15, pyroglutamyl peptidase I-like protein [Lentithecium fluviatile CBS 122367]
MAPIASTITRVLVTGFGPFQGVPNNPSWGIASRLPTSLPGNIELTIHPAAVPVAYHPVIDLLPGLIEKVQPDIALHIGVAAGRKYFAVEQTSRKGVYWFSRDVDGEVFENAEGEALWGDQPEKLSTDLDLEAVVQDWQTRTENVTWPPSLSSSSFLSKIATPSSPVSVSLGGDTLDVLEEQSQIDSDEVRWSDAVGSYLCAFIYYADMVEMSRNGKAQRRDVSFMHVPMLESEEELSVGVDVTIELVQALVRSWREQHGL